MFALDRKAIHRGTAGEPGTGLGLILCRDLVQLSGGKLWLESQPGQGTQAFVSLKQA